MSKISSGTGTGLRDEGQPYSAVTDQPMEVVEVHPPSVNWVEMTGVTMEYYPPRSRPAH